MGASDRNGAEARRTVMVTGGTGFIGGHLLRSLIDAGHRPKVLVRDPQKLMTVRELHGLPEIEFVVGDIRDPAAVAEALQGCDSCIHTAAVTAFRSSESGSIGENNFEGGRTVLDAAVAAGCDPVIHLSTVSAIFPPRGPVLSPDDPVTHPAGAYSASKAELDRHARLLQEQGAPVVIVYPGGVIGPTDAGVNVIADGMSRMLNFGFLAFPQGGGNIWIDVRDLAGALARLIEPGRGPRRYMAGGQFVPWTEFIELLQELTSGEYTVQRPTNDELKELARQGEAAAAETGEAPPLDMESAEYMCEAVPSDDSRLLEEFGLTWRPTIESWRDLLTWCAERGLLAPERSAKLLPGVGGAA